MSAYITEKMEGEAKVLKLNTYIKEFVDVYSERLLPKEITAEILKIPSKSFFVTDCLEFYPYLFYFNCLKLLACLLSVVILAGALLQLCIKYFNVKNKSRFVINTIFLCCFIFNNMLYVSQQEKGKGVLNTFKNFLVAVFYLMRACFNFFKKKRFKPTQFANDSVAIKNKSANLHALQINKTDRSNIGAICVIKYWPPCELKNTPQILKLTFERRGGVINISEKEIELLEVGPDTKYDEIIELNGPVKHTFEQMENLLGRGNR